MPKMPTRAAGGESAALPRGLCNRVPLLLIMAGGCFWGAAGCAGISPSATNRDMGPVLTHAAQSPQDVRQAEVVSDFEQRRVAAELAAAAARLEQGDLHSGEATLRRLLQRQPDHKLARHLLAETLIAQGNDAAAEQLLRELLASDAADARAHGTLAMLLDSQGRTSEAQAQLAHAVAAAPNEAAYRQRQAALQGVR